MVSSDPNLVPFHISKLLLSCDWGTTSFRLGLIEQDTRQLLSTISTSGGVKKLNQQWQATNKASTRESFFLDYLEQQIQRLAELTEHTLQEIPIVVSGMASSSIGLLELPYASVPFSLEDPALPQKLFENNEQLPRDLLLLSGIRTPSDVMRGEEVQLLGLAADRDLNNDVCLMPGTHCKHVFLEQNQVVDFKTYMTGELFELLSTQSVLADSVESSDQPLNISAFHEGLDKAKEQDFLHHIFSIRTNDLLMGLDPRQNLDLLSGLVIGTEIQALSGSKYDQLFLVGDGPLTDRYTEALHFFGHEPVSMIHPEELTLLGHLQIIQPNH